MGLEHTDTDLLQQIDNLLNSSSQSWLFGAGTSLDSGIPLMEALTERVIAGIENALEKEALDTIRSELEESCHIEHILSHLSDVRALADRKRDKDIRFGASVFTIESLDSFHQKLLTLIAETVRWGYVNDGRGREEIGSFGNSVVRIEPQAAFMGALFSHRQKNIGDRKQPVRFFTTNYDTLLEDALALSCIPYWDGFSGGAVGFRSYRYGEPDKLNDVRAQVVKLHGSIDWRLDASGNVWRVRDYDLYPEKKTRVLIYPQSTKYIATQRDPFATQFDLFRRSIGSRQEHLFAVCGYSFGDEHINQEIELAMESLENKTTMMVFAKQVSPVLRKWMASDWSRRLYVLCEEGVYVGGQGPSVAPSRQGKRDWWKFQEMTKLVQSGPEACLL